MSTQQTVKKKCGAQAGNSLTSLKVWCRRSRARALVCGRTRTCSQVTLRPHGVRRLGNRCWPWQMTHRQQVSPAKPSTLQELGRCAGIGKRAIALRSRRTARTVGRTATSQAKKDQGARPLVVAGEKTELLRLPQECSLETNLRTPTAIGRNEQPNKRLQGGVWGRGGGKPVF